jgi:uncharacterized protein YprB with RNaseH-like and TPR domain
MSSLADRLKSLGVNVGTANLPAPTRAGIPIEDVVEGRFIASRGGETFVAEQTYPMDYRHGTASIRLDVPFATLAAWARDPRLGDLPLPAFAFIDTETSGLAGGTGTYAFMVGAGRFDGEGFHLAQFFMRDPAEEPLMLDALAGFLAPCAALVTFNGKAFDAPLLRTRYVLHDIPLPFEGFSHVDLLPLARRLWRDRLPSRALKYLEENVLSAPRSLEEVPGWEIPHLYFDYLRTGDATPLKGVFYHNAMDVVAMTALFSLTAGMLADPHATRIEHGLDMIALARLFEDLNRWDDAALLYERGLRTDPAAGPGLPEADFWEAIRRLSTLQRRRGDLSTAVQLWERAADEGHIYAHVELAKYYEHRQRDIDAALQWTQAAMEHVKTADLPPYARRHWMDELDHRMKRLKGKTSKRRRE